MGWSAFRGMVSCVLIFCFPASMIGADSASAMLYARGAAWLNGSHVPASSAIFNGDLLQTRSDSGANITAPGSTITVLGDSLVKFEGSSLEVEHGGVAVATTKGIATTAGNVRVAPLTNVRTEFDVTDVDGTVRIAANKGDLAITDENGTVTLSQGQQTTRDEQTDPSTDSNTSKDKKKSKKRAEGAAPAAHGGVLSSTGAIIAGGAAITAVSVWVLTRNDDPVSPSTPGGR